MGLLRTAGRVAVASSVHGRVQRRQAQRWAAQDQAAASTPPAAPPTAPPGTGNDAMAHQLALLTQLGELKAAGVLTDAEFEAKKARILAG